MKNIFAKNLGMGPAGDSYLLVIALDFAFALRGPCSQHSIDNAKTLHTGCFPYEFIKVSREIVLYILCWSGCSAIIE